MNERTRHFSSLLHRVSAAAKARATAQSSSATSSTSTTNSSNSRDAINAQLKSVTEDLDRALLNTSLYKSNDTKRSGEDFFVADNVCYQMALTNKKATQSMCIRGAGIGNIYPGSILFVGNELTSGKPIPLTGIKRAPISVYGNFFSGKSQTIQCESTNSSVHNAINNIVHQFCGTNYEPSGYIDFKNTIYDSKAQMTLNMGVDASFCGANVSVGFNSDSQENKFVQDISLKQDFFKINLSNDYLNNLASLFDSSVTADQLKNEMKGRHMCIVSSVTYGRDIHYLKEYNLSKIKIDSTQKTTGVPYANIDFKETISKSCESTREQLVCLGGNTELTTSILKGKTSDEELKAALANTMKFGASNQGDIIDYELTVITGPNAGMKIKPTYNVDYVEKKYKPCPGRVRVRIKMETWTVASEKNVKIKFTYNTFKLGPNNQKIRSRIDVEDEKRYDDSSKYDERTLDLRPGEYVENGEARLQVRCKSCSVGSWHNDITNAPIDVSTGLIDLHLKGSTRAGSGNKSYIAKDSYTQIIG